MKNRRSMRRSRTMFLSLGVIVAIGLGGAPRLGHHAGIGTLQTRSHDKGAQPNRIGVESQARTVESKFWSSALGREMPLTVYLPPGYDSTRNLHYPVLYMLHGLGGSHLQWQRDGLFTVATEMNQAGQLPAMIIVTPEGEDGYWMDHASGGPKYGTYVARDVVAFVDSQYRTIPDGAFRAIGGMSMGAHGALQLALNNPGEFGTVGAHSLVLRNKAQAFDFFGDERSFESRDPVSILRRDPGPAQRLNLWIDIGSGDSWLAAAASFDQQLQSERVAHLWHVYSGAHDDTYWTSHLRDYLTFYGQSFEASADTISATNSGDSTIPGS